MCGIVGAVAQQPVLPVLLEGLKRLEYRGYDSAGVAILNPESAPKNSRILRQRTVGRVAQLESALENSPAQRSGGSTGIAHTRWATHGPPSEINAHPHLRSDALALVHNGIIENHEALRRAQLADGLSCESQTDSEVVVNEIYRHTVQGADLRSAVQNALGKLEGAYAIGVVSADAPQRLVGARRGSPLVVGIGDGAAYIASDMLALLSVTRDFFILEDGEIVDIQGGEITILDADGKPQTRPPYRCELSPGDLELGEYKHYMHKEIFEQGMAMADTLDGRITGSRVLEACFGVGAAEIFAKVREVRIIACGTSYHAGLVAKYWFEEYGVPCHAEIASEFRSRSHAANPHALVVTLSQSGETIDTLTALEVAKSAGFAHSLCICNSPESSLVRASDLALLTHAGVEIGVASTKAFTTQLCALLLLVSVLGRRFQLSPEQEAKLVKELRELPVAVEKVLALEPRIAAIAAQFTHKQHALFLGRGAHYPIALEGALKLKEISYIHAEGYPAGELKHGPLALVDSQMPVIAVAPNDRLLSKLKSNIEEVGARGGKLIVFADPASKIRPADNIQVVDIAAVDNAIAPIIYAIPLQLLAYHAALSKGTDVDKPRNLAKAVTVE